MTWSAMGMLAPELRAAAAVAVVALAVLVGFLARRSLLARLAPRGEDALGGRRRLRRVAA